MSLPRRLRPKERGPAKCLWAYRHEFAGLVRGDHWTCDVRKEKVNRKTCRACLVGRARWAGMP